MKTLGPSPSLWLVTLLLAACFPERTSTTVGERRVVTLQHEFVNVHAVVSGGKVLLIDSGLQRNAARLEADLRAEGISPKDVVAVVLTHGHADHAGGARFFRERFGAQVIAGRGDLPLLRKGRNDRLCPTNDDARARYERDQAETFEPFEADHLIDGPTSLESLVGVPGELLPVPGHTEGALAVKLGTALFVGDLLRGAVFTREAEVHFYMCDLEDNVGDIQRLLERTPDADTWFVGHFGPLTRAAVEARFSKGGFR